MSNNKDGGPFQDRPLARRCTSLPFFQDTQVKVLMLFAFQKKLKKIFPSIFLGI
jgi:hypothetical protein